MYFALLSRQWSQYYSKPIGALKSGVYPQISQKFLNLYPDTRSEQERTFISFLANEASIIGIQLEP